LPHCSRAARCCVARYYRCRKATSSLCYRPPATSRRVQPCLYVLNKIDSISIEELDLLDRIPHYAPVSASHRWGFDDLLEKIWQYVGMVRRAMRAVGRAP
jgi:ribosome-interacting GTPase 1